MRVTDPQIKDLAKDDTVLLGRIRRYVAAQVETDRRQDCIHPSELCRDDFCPRAVYYRISGAPMVGKPETHAFALLNIFQQGHDIHAKWQNWLWDMGELMGEFRCLSCQQMFEQEGIPGYQAKKQARWWGGAPVCCPNCDADRRFLIYDEVPVDDPEHLISGRADLRVGDRLGELKSMSIGTVRAENPTLLAKHTHTIVLDGEKKTWVDLEGVWRGIKRPFATHLRQGMLYLHATNLDQMVFIYENKTNQQTKEFVVRYNPAILEPLFETCLDIKWALEEGQRPPPCPHNGCDKCRQYEEADAPARRRRLIAPGRRDLPSEGRTGESRLPAPRPTTHGPAPAPTAGDGPGRRRPDGAVHPADGVERPYRRVIGTPRGRREVR